MRGGGAVRGHARVWRVRLGGGRGRVNDAIDAGVVGGCWGAVLGVRGEVGGGATALGEDGAGGAGGERAGGEGGGHGRGCEMGDVVVVVGRVAGWLREGREDGLKLGEVVEGVAFVGLSFWDGGVDAVLCRTYTWGCIDRRLHKKLIRVLRLICHVDHCT